MTDETCAFELVGVRVEMDANGAAFLPEAETLIVSDLHFEKGSAFAAKGQFLPPYDTRATLVRITQSLERFSPRRVVALGDSFHDLDAGARIAADDWAAIERLASAHEWVWITGNHDEELPSGIAGAVAEELSIGPLTLRHEPLPAALAEGEVAGHLHPCAVVRTRSRNLRRRCFVSDGRRLIMPAYGAFTGGLNIADAAYDGLFVSAITAYVLGQAHVYAIPESRLAGVA